MLISGTVQKLQQRKYAGQGNLFPFAVAGLRRPNTLPPSVSGTTSGKSVVDISTSVHLGAILL